MAETEEQLEESSNKKGLLIKKFFHPDNLKKIIIGTVVAVVLIIVIGIVWSVISDVRPSNVPFLYKNLGKITFTGDSKDYGSFFCSLRINIGCKSESVFEELDDRKYEVKDSIRKTISRQNYYMIDTEEKRKHNLNHEIINELNNLLLKNPGGIRSISFTQFSLQFKENDSTIRNTYFDAGTTSVLQYTDSVRRITDQYKISTYIVYDASSQQFNSLLLTRSNVIQDRVEEVIKESGRSYLMDKKNRPLFLNDTKGLQKYLKNEIKKKLSSYFLSLEQEIKRKNPLYDKANEQKLKDIVFALFLKRTTKEDKN